MGHLCEVINQLQDKILHMKDTHPSTPQTGMSWAEQKSRLKAKFLILNESDLFYESGKKEEMYERIQKKLGKTKAEFELMMKTL